MKKYQIFGALGLLAAGSVLLSACGSGAAASFPDVIKVQTVESSGENTLNVNSRETVKVTPDMAEIVCGITTENADAAACQQENTEKLNAVVEYLKGLGYDESSIQTSDFSLNPRYDWSGNTQELVGYEMTSRVTLTNVPMDQVGSLLSETVAAGANEICSVSYFSSKYDECYQEALTKAVETARAKAETLAAASGQKVGAVISIQEYGENQSAKYVSSNMNFAREESVASAAADMAVMPGEMEISAQIGVEFELVQE